MAGIVEIQLERLAALLEERKITLELTDAAKRWLAEAGYDPVYGARPLKRTIQKSLQDPLARLILEGRIRDGDPVQVDAGDSGLLINGAAVRSRPERREPGARTAPGGRPGAPGRRRRPASGACGRLSACVR